MECHYVAIVQRIHIGKTYNNAGMSTVEAAIIVPFLFFCIITFVYISFYFMDLAKIYASVDTVLVYAAEAVDKSENLKRGCDDTYGLSDLEYRNHNHIFEIIPLKEKDFEELDSYISEQCYQRLLSADCITKKIYQRQEDLVYEGELHAEIKGFSSFGIQPIAFSYKRVVRLGSYADKLREHSAKAASERKKEE